MLRGRPAAVVALAVLTLIAITSLVAFGAGRGIELPLRDAAMRLLPSKPATSSIVVAIDEESIRRIGKWPWRRDVLAKIIDRAASAGAKAVIVDILLAESDAGDDVLSRSMRRVPTLTVSVLDNGEWLAPAPTIRAAAEPAHGNFELDGDGIVRRFASTKQSRDRARTALSVAAASIVTGAPVPVGVSIAPMFRTRPDDIPLISAADVLDSPAAASRLHAKLVFLGPTAHALGDRVLTPVTAPLKQDPGVTVHAAATESLIRGEVIREPPPYVIGIIAAIAASVILTANARIAATACVIAIAGGGLLLFAKTGIAIPFATMLAPVVISTAAVEGIGIARSLRRSHEEVVRLEQIATRIARQQTRDAESKRVLAHELKTPLASMRGLSQLLAGYDLTDAERRRVASLLEAEAGKLQSMVSGLLDIERLPFRDFETSTSVIDLVETVASRVAFVRASTDRQVIMQATPSVFVRADAALIERVVDNLVSNALKYSPSAVSVSVTSEFLGSSGRSGSSGASGSSGSSGSSGVSGRSGAAAEEPRNPRNRSDRRDQAVLTVSDRGPGIAPADRERLFDRFFRGTAAAGTEGLGLGLALVAEVARWHGGGVSVDEADGGGARFRFELPLAPAVAKAEGT